MYNHSQGNGSSNFFNPPSKEQLIQLKKNLGLNFASTYLSKITSFLEEVGDNSFFEGLGNLYLLKLSGIDGSRMPISSPLVKVITQAFFIKQSREKRSSGNMRMVTFTLNTVETAHTLLRDAYNKHTLPDKKKLTRKTNDVFAMTGCLRIAFPNKYADLATKGKKARDDIESKVLKVIDVAKCGDLYGPPPTKAEQEEAKATVNKIFDESKTILHSFYKEDLDAQQTNIANKPISEVEINKINQEVWEELSASIEKIVLQVLFK